MSDKAGRNGNVIGTKWRLQPGSPWDRERGKEEARCKREWEREETLLARSSGGLLVLISISRGPADERQSWQGRRGQDQALSWKLEELWSSDLVRARLFRESVSTTMNVWLS
jgi:hypothetical protein